MIRPLKKIQPILHKTNIQETKPIYLKKEQKSILIFDENNRIYNYILKLK